MRIEFVLDMIPPTATAQQKGEFWNGRRIVHFKKRPVRSAEEVYAALLFPHRPPEPLKGAVTLEIEYRFPFRKSERRSVVKAGLPIPKTTRPDLTNMDKALEDVMTRLGFWLDDSQICKKVCAKVYAANPGVAFRIEGL